MVDLSGASRWAALFFFFATSAVAQDPNRLYAVTFYATSAEDGDPLRGATIAVKGSGVSNVDYGTTQDLAGRGVTLNESGAVTVYMKAGTYTVSWAHSAHRSQAFVVKVPPPGYEDKTEADFELQMTMRKEILSRPLTVSVRGETPGGGSEPLYDARIHVIPESSGRTETLTESNGVHTFNMPFLIGDPVRVIASKEGYVSQETTIYIGSRQNNPLDAGFTNSTTTSDRVDFVLKRGTGTIVPPPRTGGAQGTFQTTLIIEAIRSDLNLPVAGAVVRIENTGREVVANGITNGQGRADLTFTAGPAGPGLGAFRVRVNASGMSEKWSDIPDSYLVPRAERPYVVFLELGAPATTKTGWTASEEAAFKRFVQWAKARRLKFVGDEAITELYDQASVSWTEKDPRGPFWGEAHLKYNPHGAGTPYPGEQALFFRDGDPVSLGSGPGRLDRSGRRTTWVAGWFSVLVVYNSANRTTPTADDALALAREVAGVLGNP